MIRGEIASVADWFSRETIVQEMAADVDRGLKIWEKEAAQAWFLPNSRVLDIGCGPGREAFVLSDMGFDVTGIDIAKGQIDAANANNRTLGKSISFHVVEGFEYPFEDASFDAAIMWSQAFGNVYGEAAKLALLAECKRLLTEDGIVCVSGHDRDFLKANHPQYVKDDLFYPYGEDGCAWETFTVSELERLMVKAGFHTLYCGPGAVYVPENGTVLYCAAQKQNREIL